MADLEILIKTSLTPGTGTGISSIHIPFCGCSFLIAFIIEKFIDE
jgi:hypothetical protein